MASPLVIVVGEAPPIPVLHDDRDVLVVDKPSGWRAGVVPNFPPQPGEPDLQAALDRALAEKPAWATAADLGYLRVVGHLDTEATGLLMLARSSRAAEAFHRHLERRPACHDFLVIVGGKPSHRRWVSCLKIRPDPTFPGRVLTHTTEGFRAETSYEVLAHGDGMALLLARPLTLRPHQIRAQLAAQSLPVLGDRLYGFGRDNPRTKRRGPARDPGPARGGIALRAGRLRYTCPFSARPIEVFAPVDEFLAGYGFALGQEDWGGLEEHDEPDPDPGPDTDAGPGRVRDA